MSANALYIVDHPSAPIGAAKLHNTKGAKHTTRCRS